MYVELIHPPSRVYRHITQVPFTVPCIEDISMRLREDIYMGGCTSDCSASLRCIKKKALRGGGSEKCLATSSTAFGLRLRNASAGGALRASASPVCPRSAKRSRLRVVRPQAETRALLPLRGSNGVAQDPLQMGALAPNL